MYFPQHLFLLFFIKKLKGKIKPRSPSGAQLCSPGRFRGCVCRLSCPVGLKPAPRAGAPRLLLPLQPWRWVCVLALCFPFAFPVPPCAAVLLPPGPRVSLCRWCAVSRLPGVWGRGGRAHLPPTPARAPRAAGSRLGCLPESPLPGGRGFRLLLCGGLCSPSTSVCSHCCTESLRPRSVPAARGHVSQASGGPTRDRRPQTWSSSSHRHLLPGCDWLTGQLYLLSGGVL